MRANNKPMPRTFQINIRLNETEYNNLSRSAQGSWPRRLCPDADVEGLERAKYAEGGLIFSSAC